MKRTLLIILLATIYLFGAEFKVISFEKNAMDLTARMKSTKLIDVNGNVCALVKVQTDLKDLSFESKYLEKFEYAQDGEYWVYLQKNSKRLKLKKEDLTPYTYTFPDKLEKSMVYILKLTAVGLKGKLKDLAINVITTPLNAKIYIDGVEKGEQSKIMTSVGKHKIIIKKPGYKTIQKNIEVSATNTYFNYTLEKLADALLEINSNPPGAKVVINEIEIGITPVSLFYPAGSYKGVYPITLTKENYEDIEETIEIKLNGARKTYQLTDISATLTINTHEKARVYINGVLVSDYKDIKLSPQIVNVKVEMDKARTLEEEILLGKKDNKTLDMYPIILTGEVQITVVPSDAKIELWEDYHTRIDNYYRSTSIGSKNFDNVPIGSYELRIRKKGYKTIHDNLRVNEDKVVTMSIKLKERSGVDYLISARVSHPYFLNANFTILPQKKRTSILYRGSIGVNACRIGIGFGSAYLAGEKDIVSMLGASWTVNYLLTYNKKDATWADNDIMGRSFLGIELNLAIFVGIDIGAYYSIAEDKKGKFLFVWGFGLFY